MKNYALRLVLQTLALLLGASLLSQAQSANTFPADTIVLHGRVYTENEKQPWAQAVAIRGAKIIAVGSDAEIEKLRNAGTKVIDAAGRLALPGFVDSHIHFLDGSLSLGRVNLEGATDAVDIQKRLREYADKHPGDGWILGRGWNYAMFVRPFESRAQGGQLFSARWLRNYPGDEILSCFFQCTGGFARSWIAHNCAVWRVGSFARDPGER